MNSENEDLICRNCEFAVSINAQNELEKQYTELKINPNDKIGIKLNSLYEKHLLRQIDPEGLIFFYKQIQNMQIDYNDVEKQIQNSPEYASQLKKYNP